MEIGMVERLKQMRFWLAKLVEDFHPANDLEIETVGLLCRAHDIIARIDPDKLGQLPLPETKAPAGPPKEQLPLVMGAAVIGGEGSLNVVSSVPLAQTAEDEFNTIKSAGRKRRIKGDHDVTD